MAGAKGAAACGHGVTLKAAGDILTGGGNAVDAAIAGAFAACVCEPVLASPGGGGFAMVRDPAGGCTVFDFFVQTPVRKAEGPVEFTRIKADFGPALQGFHIGHGATATPGFVAGLQALAGAAGTLGLPALMKPAIQAARDGVTVNGFQAYLFGVVAPILLASGRSRSLFAPDGHLLKQGETFYNRQLARFFETLADDWYSPLLDDQAQGGHLRAEDFAAYEVIRRTPLEVGHNGARIFFNPPPSAGGVMIAGALGLLDGSNEPAMARALAAMDEARCETGGDLGLMLARFGPPAYRGTTHISVVDANGGACAITLSNGEGNGHMAGNLGFMANNMLGEADVNPHGKTGWREDVRLSSMMAPGLMIDGDGAMTAFGSGGSNRIRSAILCVLTRMIDGKLDARTAVDAARLHVENGHLDFEGHMAPDMIKQLETAFADQRQWPDPNMFFGGCHMAGRRGDGSFYGAGDARRSGVFAVIE